MLQWLTRVSRRYHSTVLTAPVYVAVAYSCVKAVSFHCPDGTCVPMTFHLDGQKDCANGTDEGKGREAVPTPTPAGVRCSHPGRCPLLPPRQVSAAPTPAGVRCSHPGRLPAPPRQVSAAPTPAGVRCSHPGRCPLLPPRQVSAAPTPAVGTTYIYL